MFLKRQVDKTAKKTPILELGWSEIGQRRYFGITKSVNHSCLRVANLVDSLHFDNAFSKPFSNIFSA
jgi:hypothetical protein